MTENLDTGHRRTAEASGASSTVLAPVALPTVLVFNDVTSLAESVQSLGTDRPLERDPSMDRGVDRTGPATDAVGTNGGATTAEAGDVSQAPAPATPHQDPYHESIADQAPEELVTDEERNRYGLLLDSAAERGLLNPADYEIRLGELARATTTAQMVELVAELPAFAPSTVAPAPTRSRRAIQSANRTGVTGERRRVVMWALLGLLVIVAVVSLVILAISAERLSRSRSSSPPPAPVAARPVSALRL
jgi:hypothetical protein